MAFSTILLRRSTSLAIQASRNYSSPPAMKLFSPTTTTTTIINNLLLHNNFSSGSAAITKMKKDDSLVRVIESEIECAQQSDDFDRVEETPNGFPFKIQDHPRHQTITLKREYNGEDIKVQVRMPSLVTGNQDDDEDDNDDDDESEKARPERLPLLVTVSKKSGPCLEFGVTAFPDEVTIESMSVREQDSAEDGMPYEGPDFTTLDENLQKTFHKYLEIRGIKPLTTNFLFEYMINKDSREYLFWLNNLKKFVES